MTTTITVNDVKKVKKAVKSSAEKCCTVKGRLGFLRFNFNPVVTVFSAIIIWSMVVWCIRYPESSKEHMTVWKDWITNTWTWFYIGTQNIWIVFILILYFSKYSKLKLGKDDEKPEYNDATYFTMLFAAGVGIGLFYFGVAEPIYHYEPGENGNRYWGRVNDNQRSQDALNLTFFHWGLHAWIVYTIVALLLAFLAYRKDLPMTMRTCFQPLLGDKVFGFLGDCIDILSVVATMFGVCTSLGLGVIQLNTGINRINKSVKVSVHNQIIIIWGVTAIATASVVSGVKIGIRRLSEICFAVGVFIMLVVLFHDNTWYLMNLYTQTCGYYIQNIIQLGFHTDAFAQLGNALDGKENPTWMDDWTIFYWGWWIAWSPFVGMFIAKISRGRTIKDFISYTLTVPMLYTFLWLTIFGGSGLLMERTAAKLEINCSSELGGTNATEGLNGIYRLSCRSKEDMWFDVMGQYGDLGGFLSILSLIGIILYFVTSSDSGSLVIDCLSANGNPDPPILQRIFWALTEGACATALLTAGGKQALSALQTAAIVAGLPYTVVMNFLCVAIWRAVKEELGDYDPKEAQFTMGIFDIDSLERLGKMLVSIVAPWYYMGKTAAKLSKGKAIGYIIFLALMFNLWIALLVVEVRVKGISYVAWALFILFIGYIAAMRINVREKYSIDGNMAEDFFSVLLLYPLAVVQMEDQVFKGRAPYRNGRLSVKDNEEDLELASSETASNSSSHSFEMDEKCSMTAL